VMIQPQQLASTVVACRLHQSKLPHIRQKHSNTATVFAILHTKNCRRSHVGGLTFECENTRAPRSRSMSPPGADVMMTEALAAAAAAAAYPNVLPGEVMRSLALLMMMMSTCVRCEV
jgi:hypothetical protein